MPQIIYGGSDDLVELAGDVDEEFTSLSGSVTETGFLATSNGVLVKYELDDELEGWRFRVVSKPAGVDVEVIAARGDGEPNDADGCPGYSDKVVITGPEPVAWVLHGSTYARSGQSPRLVTA